MMNQHELIHIILRVPAVKTDAEIVLKLSQLTNKGMARDEVAAESEKLENCLGRCACRMTSAGFQYIRIGVDPGDADKFNPRNYGFVEVLDYPTHDEDGNPNRDAYFCGTSVWTNEEGGEQTSPVMLGVWQ